MTNKSQWCVAVEAELVIDFLYHLPPNGCHVRSCSRELGISLLMFARVGRAEGGIQLACCGWLVGIFGGNSQLCGVKFRGVNWTN